MPPRHRTRTKRTPTPADPVSRYARAVLDGRIVAGRAVRLACERHFRDYARQRTKAFPYYFSAPAAKHIIEFFSTFIRLEDAVTSMVLAPWAQFALGSIYGWRRMTDDGRRFQHGYVETGKGSGKTPYLAGVGLYGLAFDSEPSAEVYVAAFDRGQAEVLMRDAIRMANDSPDLAAMLDIGKYNIAHLESGSFFRAVSSEHRSKSGPRPSLVLIDEEHEHRDGTVIAKMVAGFKGRAQPLALRITNSGSDKTSICWQHHEHSLNVLEGSLADEQWFAYACQLDPCETCYAEGYREPKDGCPDCDDWTDPKVWPKTNPSLTIGLPRHTYLQSQVDAATAMPGEQALVKRLNFCIWTQVHTLWIPADRWEACRVPDVGSCLDGARAAAFDMSEKLDLTACVVGIKVAAPEDEPVQTIDITDIEGDDLIHKSFEMNFYVDLIPYFWLPEDTLRERVTKERIPFDVWSQTCCRCGLHMREHGRLDHRFDPCLRVTPGPVIDYDQIYAEFTQDIGKRFQPSRVGYDPHNATQFMVQLRDKAKYTVVEVAQGRKLSESFKLFQALAALKRIRHAGNPVMSWCVSNAEKKTDRYENIWCEKNSPTKRIDGVIAAVMVLNQLMLLPFKSTKRRRGQAKVWTPEGFKSMDSSTNTGVPSHA